MSVEADPPGRMESAALHWATLGYSVFPCSKDKKPLVEHGVKDATMDAARIRAWWREWPDANIAVSTDGLILIDVDGAGNTWLSADPDLAAQLMAVPLTRTPRGGRHHWFRQPAGRAWKSTVSKLAPKVDTRGYGGYVVVPPSQGENGNPYFFPDGMGVDAGPGDLPEPMPWLADMLDADGAVRKLTLAGANTIPPGVRNATLARLAGAMRRIGMTATEILPAVCAVNRERCTPPVPDKEVAGIVGSISRYEPDQITVALAEGWAAQDSAADPGPLTSKELMMKHPVLHPPVIHGLLREGEIMNIIAPSKTGKSWGVIDLALSVVTGRHWLGTFACEKGDVLIVDNELHAATSANRIPRVADARQVPAPLYEDHLYVDNLRGQLKDLTAMRPYFDRFEPGRFKLIVLDAFYRFLPVRTDENDNGSITGLYNQLDYHAARLKCAFVLIHHSSKGVQSFKEVTDVGAGAGAQARATDTHLILRRHEEEAVVVMESAIRSWPAQRPLCLRFDFPVWNVAQDLDPTRLKQEGKRRAKAEVEDAETAPEEPEWTTPRFVETFIGPKPKSVARILEEGEQAGASMRRAKRFLELAEEEGLIHRCDMGQKRVGYSTGAQPKEPETQAEAMPSKRQSVVDLLRAEPDLPATEIARRGGVSARYVRRIRAGMEGGADVE